MDLKLLSPVSLVKGVGEKTADILQNRGISTLLDLLLHFPLLHIDFSRASSRLMADKLALYRVGVSDSRLSRNYPRRLSLLKIAAVLGEYPFELVFFNMPYMIDFFKNKKEVFVYGMVKKHRDLYQIINPMVFPVDAADSVLPKYKPISTIKSGRLKTIIRNGLDSLRDDWDPLPDHIVKKYRFLGVSESLRKIHFPGSEELSRLSNLKQRFVFTEFFLFQLELQAVRQYFKSVDRHKFFRISPGIREEIERITPFTLTPDQQSVLRDIFGDLESPYTMKRLVQGDVGTGKTIVVLIALHMAVQNGFQGAFLAPTEILIQQHYKNTEQLFPGYRLAVLTGSTPESERNRIRGLLKKGEIDILFGTHAILGDDIGFKNLQMIVIDEQHRFGVSQRAALYFKARGVDLLVTTATPIPRTMLLSLYNDLDVSTVRSKPRGRREIRTRIIWRENRESFYPKLKQRILEGDKVYVVFPLIEPSEFFPDLSAIESQKEFLKIVFEGIPVGIVSGKTPPVKKDATIEKFKQGKIKVLVCTTVIEVGMDVPDATIMVIEDADRYGLAQLHQLRGRVGRGDLQSHCFLIPSEGITSGGMERLKTIRDTGDGFEIAEKDLEMRGGGLVTGLEQSGRLDFKVGDVTKDFKIFRDARKEAEKVLKQRELSNPFIDRLLTECEKKIKKISFS